MFILILIPPPSRSTLFPYTTLFRSLKVRTLMLRDFQKAFDRVDVILVPTSPTVAFNIGEKTGDPLAMYLSDIFTITDRKSTRLNSSHLGISYAVFCLKKKRNKEHIN